MWIMEGMRQDRARKEVDKLRSRVNLLGDQATAAERTRREADEQRSEVSYIAGTRMGRVEDTFGDGNVNSREKDTSLIKSLENFIEEQMRMMSVRARATTVQNFPPLPRFTSEEIDCEMVHLRDLKSMQPYSQVG